MVESYRYITKRLLFEQLEGGSFGAIRLLVDTIKREIYVIPPKSYHSVVATFLLGLKNISELQKNPQAASYLVPAVIEMDNNIITGAIVGKSSLEISIHVKHNVKELAEAEHLVNRFITLSDELGTISIKRSTGKLIVRATGERAA